jgi:hypothetical protein
VGTNKYDRDGVSMEMENRINEENTDAIQSNCFRFFSLKLLAKTARERGKALRGYENLELWAGEVETCDAGAARSEFGVKGDRDDKWSAREGARA